MRKFRSVVGPLSLGLMILVALVASISLLSAAKGGNGREGQASGGSFVQIVVNGTTFTHNLTNNELAEDARDALVALINADPAFSATATTVSGGIFELDDVVLEVLTAGGGEVDSVISCETDGTFLNSGVFFVRGTPKVSILKPTAVGGAGTFNVRFELLNAPDVDLTIPTVVGDVAGLLAAITSGLTGLGFSVVDTGTELEITKLGDKFFSSRVEAADALITATCMGMILPPPEAESTILPLLHPTGLLLLAVGLLLAGILIIRRKATA